jgi:hypothetical protein
LCSSQKAIHIFVEVFLALSGRGRRKKEKEEKKQRLTSSPRPALLDFLAQLCNFGARPIHDICSRPRLVKLWHAGNLLVFFVVDETGFGLVDKQLACAANDDDVVRGWELDVVVLYFFENGMSVKEVVQFEENEEKIINTHIRNAIPLLRTSMLYEPRWRFDSRHGTQLG